MKPKDRVKSVDASRPQLKRSNGNGSNGNGHHQGMNGHSRLSGSRNGVSAENRLDLSRWCVESEGRFPGWKRALDITFVIVTVPCWLPLMLLVMALIRFNSSGPIIYRQQRVGYRRKLFMIFKFRTMHVNVDTRTHEEYFADLMRSDRPMTKLDTKGDTRVFRGGRFLRVTGLDELPQIFNVLRGDMSLVGPRPCLPNEFERYKSSEQLRVNAPPGLTGYWQVNGKNNTTFKEMIAMDVFYIANMSPWLDLKIISRTIPVLFGQAKTSISSRLRKQAIPAVPLMSPARVEQNGSTHSL